MGRGNPRSWRRERATKDGRYLDTQREPRRDKGRGCVKGRKPRPGCGRRFLVSARQRQKWTGRAGRYLCLVRFWRQAQVPAAFFVSDCTEAGPVSSDQQVQELQWIFWTTTTLKCPSYHFSCITGHIAFQRYLFFPIKALLAVSALKNAVLIQGPENSCGGPTSDDIRPVPPLPRITSSMSTKAASTVKNKEDVGLEERLCVGTRSMWRLGLVEL